MSSCCGGCGSQDKIPKKDQQDQKEAQDKNKEQTNAEAPKKQV
jgi:hypothetical protein